MMLLLRDSLLSVIGCFGFGILFNIKGKKLLFASFGGGVSWFVYALCLNHYNFSIISSMLASSIIFSIYSEVMARLLKTPVTLMVICAMLPLVPGAGMYYTMYEAVKGNISASVSNGLSTLASAGTLALGIILVATITRILTKKNVKNTKTKASALK